MKKYIILHFSDNWMMEGLSTEYFTTYDDALKYVANFKSKNRGHKNDKIKIVELLEEFEAEEVDHGIYGFNSNNSKLKSKNK